MTEDALRVVELFAGIGAQASALERLGIDFRSTVCEIDDHAYRMYCANHGDAPNLGDITGVEHLPECDLLTYSFPCQDLSVAGMQRGMAEGSGTRSSLLWEVARLLKDSASSGTLPEVLLMENVDAILHEANMPHFKRFVLELDALGYTSSYKVLNARDFGVPQNRKRCFMVSTLHMGRFVFPDGRPLDRRLKDVLEPDVDESYYLSDERIASYERWGRRQEANGRGFRWDPISESASVSKAVTTNPSRHTGTFIRVAGDLNWDGWHESIRRVYDPSGLSPVIPTGAGGGPHAEDRDRRETRRCEIRCGLQGLWGGGNRADGRIEGPSPPHQGGRWN